MSVLFAIFLAVIGLIAVFFLYGFSTVLLDKRYRLPPGPKPWPFIGNFPLLAVKNNEKKTWMVLRDMAEKYGPVFTFYFGKYRAIVLTDSELVHEALVTQSKNFNWRIDNYIPGFDEIRSGIISANHDVWRQRRRFGTKAMRDFGMGKEAMVQKIQDELSHFIPEMESRCGKPFNPRRLLTNTVSNVICSLVFGKRFNYDDVEFQKLLAQIEVVVTRSIKASAMFFSMPILRYVQQPVQVQDFRTIQKLTTKIVAEAIKENRRDYDPENIRDFPDLFIQAEMSGEDAMDLDTFGLVMTDMFVAGTETTSTALNWTLLYLSTWPEIQERCHAAIEAVIDTNRLPSLADRPKLVYLDAVMCEVLRHCFIVPGALFHSNLENSTKLAGYDVPPYSIVMYNVAALHYDAKYWKDPEVFNPDRWISPADGKLLSHSTHFMPFGIGPRICLGESLARVEYFLFITAMLHRFRFSLKSPVNLRDGISGVVHSPPNHEIIVNRR